jgi:hypothetical protein
VEDVYDPDGQITLKLARYEANEQGLVVTSQFKVMRESGASCPQFSVIEGGLDAAELDPKDHLPGRRIFANHGCRRRKKFHLNRHNAPHCSNGFSSERFSE